MGREMYDRFRAIAAAVVGNRKRTTSNRSIIADNRGVPLSMMMNQKCSFCYWEGNRWNLGDLVAGLPCGID